VLAVWTQDEWVEGGKMIWWLIEHLMFWAFLCGCFAIMIGIYSPDRDIVAAAAFLALAGACIKVRPS